MFYVYIIKSLTHKTLYVGSSQDPVGRLENQHNKGKVRYTKGRLPWKLVYSEKYNSRSEALQREKYLKSGRGREELKAILINR